MDFFSPKAAVAGAIVVVLGAGVNTGMFTKVSNDLQKAKEKIVANEVKIDKLEKNQAKILDDTQYIREWIAEQRGKENGRNAHR